MADDVTRTVVAKLRVEREGDAEAFKQTATDIGALPKAADEATSALEAFGEMLGQAARSGEDLSALKDEINAVVAAAAEFNLADSLEGQQAALDKLKTAWDAFGEKAKTAFSSADQAGAAYAAGLQTITARQQELTAAMQQTAQANQTSASSFKASGDSAAWVAEQTAKIMGSAQQATPAILKYGESYAAAAKSTELFNVAGSASSGLLAAILLKLEPTERAIFNLRLTSDVMTSSTKAMADAVGIQLPEAYGRATSAATNLAVAVFKGNWDQARADLAEYVLALKDYVAETANIGQREAKLNDEVVNRNKTAREELQATLKAQRDMVAEREKDAAAMERQAAVLERQIKAEQAAGEVTKQTADAAADLLDKYESIGKTAPAGFEAAARSAGVLADATERAASAAEDLDAAAGSEGAASGIGALSAAVTQVVDPLTDLATKAQTAAEALGKDEFAEPGKGLDKLGTAADAAGASVDSAAESVRDLGDGVDEIEPKFDELRDTATEAFDGISKSAGLMVDKLEAKVPAAFQRMIDNAKRSNDALFGLKPGESRGPEATGPTTPRQDEPQAETRAARDAAADVTEAMAAATAAIDKTNAAGKQFATDVAPAIVRGLSDIAAASVFGEDGGLGSLQTQLEALAAIQFAGPILEQLYQVVAGAERAAAALASIGDAAGDDAPAAPAPSSGPSSFQTGAG